jgi:hypothetical protein
MDGRGRWLDNVFIERLWRSVKYEEVYLKAYETILKPAANSPPTSTSTTPGGATKGSKAGPLLRSTGPTLRKERTAA